MPTRLELNLGTDAGREMATTKATLVASRIEYIQATLAKIERELENAEGSHKETLQKWVVAIQEELKKLRRNTAHKLGVH